MTPTREKESHPAVIDGDVVGNDDQAHGAEVELYDRALFPDLLSQDPAVVTERFARRFMAAESLDELFDVLEGKLARDLIGKALRITQVQWAPYQADNGIIPLAIVTAAEVPDGEAVEFATTSMALTMFLVRAQAVKALPFTAKITATKTRSGQTALNFARA